MARARNIKPGFFANDELAQCEYGARLMFAGLWTIADREGRLEDRPTKIKGQLFPYDNCDPEAWLSQLAERGFITRYEITGRKYIQINNFHKHQNPHVKEQASTIPAPGMPDARPEVAGLIPDSLLLIPDSPKPQPDAPHRPASASSSTEAIVAQIKTPPGWPEAEFRKLIIEWIEAVREVNPRKRPNAITLESLIAGKLSAGWDWPKFYRAIHHSKSNQWETVQEAPEDRGSKPAQKSQPPPPPQSGEVPLFFSKSKASPKNASRVDPAGRG